MIQEKYLRKLVNNLLLEMSNAHPPASFHPTWKEHYKKRHKAISYLQHIFCCPQGLLLIDWCLCWGLHLICNDKSLWMVRPWVRCSPEPWENLECKAETFAGWFSVSNHFPLHQIWSEPSCPGCVQHSLKCNPMECHCLGRWNILQLCLWAASSCKALGWEAMTQMAMGIIPSRF